MQTTTLLRPAARLALAALFPLATLAPRAAADQIGDKPEANDRFGSALCTGDFDGNDRPDLAIGVPNESVAAVGAIWAGAGEVQVVYSKPPFIQLGPTVQAIVQGGATSGAPGIGVGNAFGSALAAGDFDGDGFDDLAIGIPGQDVNGIVDAGAVHVRNGSPTGLLSGTTWTQDSTGVPDFCEAGDAFGAALCAGDFNGDGFDDLAIGVPGEDAGSIVDSGAVIVLVGSPTGLKALLKGVWTQGGKVLDVAEAGDRFGSSLASGELDGDGFDDLVIGVPFETLSAPAQGAVHVIYGSSKGLQAANDQFWSQGAAGLDGVPGADEHFGWALTCADLDMDGRIDLAIGAPEDVVAGARGGSVLVLYGTTSGLSATDNYLVVQSDPAIIDQTEEGDRFGAALAAHTMQGLTMLVVGIPGEDDGGLVDVGAVERIGLGFSRVAGSSHFIVSGFSFFLGAGDALGSALAIADFDALGEEDIAMGVPLCDQGAVDAGQAIVFGISSSFYTQVLIQGP